MPGQPTSFNCATVIANEVVSATTPLSSPYNIVESGDNVTLRSYFHCNSPDGVVRNTIDTILTTFAAVTVRYYFQDLQAQTLAPFAPPPIAFEPGGPFARMTDTEVTTAFRPGGDLAGLNLDPTDLYYRSAATAAITTGPAPGPRLALPAGTVNGTWRVLTVLRGVVGAQRVTAFDDRLIIHVMA